MQLDSFIDYYGLLGLTPEADAQTIVKRFHRTAKRYHPDNPLSGDRDRFDRLVEAYGILRDAAKRAKYDELYEQVVGPKRKQAGRPNNDGTVERDVETQEKLLSVLYDRRRGSIRNPGVNNFELERIVTCTTEELEFPLWYMKAKRWIERLENGMVAITVEGVDHINQEHQRRITRKLLTDTNQLDDDWDS